MSGVQHEAPDAKMIGYQRILDTFEHTCDTVVRGSSLAESTAEYIIGDSTAWDLSNAESAAEYLLEKKDNPFFLSFGIGNTHREFPDIDPDRYSAFDASSKAMSGSEMDSNVS